MSLPIKKQTDLIAWFMEACPKCRKIFLDELARFLAAHEREVVRKILRKEPLSFDLDIYDKLCPRCQGVYEKYTKIEVDQEMVKKMMFGRGGKRARKSK